MIVWNTALMVAEMVGVGAATPSAVGECRQRAAELASSQLGEPAHPLGEKRASDRLQVVEDGRARLRQPLVGAESHLRRNLSSG